VLRGRELRQKPGAAGLRLVAADPDAAHYAAAVPAPDDSTRRYGSWAVIAGASEGLGAAFADALAARGHKLLLIARRAGLLAEVAVGIERERGVEVRTVALDLANPDLSTALAEVTEGLDIGVPVCNAAFSPIGRFLDRSTQDLLDVVDVNVRGPVLFLRTLPPTVSRPEIPRELVTTRGFSDLERPLPSPIRTIVFALLAAASFALRSGSRSVNALARMLLPGTRPQGRATTS
jgi:NAD(P)-dependent dehydrogenase (short-subunit alcohol dehydrogenase family)